MLDHLRRIAKKMDLKVEDGEAQDEKGTKIPVLIIQHGEFKLVAIDHKSYTVITIPIDIPQEDAEILAKEPPEIQQSLFSIVKREMSEGRSGYFMFFDETKEPPRLKGIRIEQRVIVPDEQPQTIQRVTDGIQEIVTVTMRVMLVLGQAFQDVKAAAQTSASTYHPGMYA
jgi:hypothetical protein